MDVMADNLPIMIKASPELSACFGHFESIVNKLEAQLNFHTLTANWYGDEDDILMIHFDLLTHDELTQVLSQDSYAPNERPADDVILLTPALLERHCYVAITASEMTFLTQQPKLLSGYLAKKVTKVLNIIASNEQLTKI